MISKIYAKQHLKGKIHMGTLIVNESKDFNEFEEYKECLKISKTILGNEEDD